MIIREKYDSSGFGDFVKVVVDLERNILAAGCELHIDCAEELEKDGSSQKTYGAQMCIPKPSK